MSSSHYDAAARPVPPPARLASFIRGGSLLGCKRGPRRGRAPLAPDHPPAALGYLPLQDHSAGGSAPASSRLLSDFNFRRNGIGFLRFFFASAVVWSHAFTLGGFGVDPLYSLTKGAEDAGALAVDGFFVLSGFLIVRSFEGTANVGRFLWHRTLRIFPGFWACLVAVAFAFAPVLFFHDRGTLAGYFSSPNSPWTYLTANAFLAMNQYNIAGLLAKAPVPLLFNRSLWTLQYEFYCYIMVAALGTFAILGKRRSILLLPLAAAFALFVAGSSVRGLQGVPTTLRSMELYTFFAIGSCAYLYRNRIRMRGSIALLALLSIAATLPTGIYGVVLPFTLSYLTLYAAMLLPLRDFDRRCDFSYGIYIYAFPISQLLTAFGAPATGFAPYFGAAYAISLAFAVASWFGIEKRALTLKTLSLKAFLSGRMEHEARDAQISHGIGSARGI